MSGINTYTLNRQNYCYVAVGTVHLGLLLNKGENYCAETCSVSVSTCTMDRVADGLGFVASRDVRTSDCNFTQPYV